MSSPPPYQDFIQSMITYVDEEDSRPTRVHWELPSVMPYFHCCQRRRCYWRCDGAVAPATHTTKLNRTSKTRSIWKMLGPFATTSRLTPIQQTSLAVLSRAACASMSTTTTTKTTTTTTTRDRGDRYGPMEWAQLYSNNDSKIIVRKVIWRWK